MGADYSIIHWLTIIQLARKTEQTPWELMKLSMSDFLRLCEEQCVPVYSGGEDTRK